jgi:hypothetical protein
MTKQMMAVLDALTKSGNFNPTICEWEQKPDGEKTWENIKVFTCKEYTKAQKQGALTARQAGFGSANAMQEAITDVTKDQANLATNVVNTLKEMKLTITKLQKKVDQKAATTSSESTEAGKSSYYAEKRAKQRKKWEVALVCKHCNGKHPRQPEDKCWELEANAATPPLGWKSKKSSST